MSGPTRIRDLAAPGGGQPALPSFLFMCDEWIPRRGGISRFNRSLAIATARAGCSTTCLVEAASQEEQQDAEAHGVNLAVAAGTARGPNMYVPLEHVLAQRPDVVVGHDVVTGPEAEMWAKRYLGNTALVLVIHNTPAKNEPFKRTAEAARRTVKRERILRTIRADVVAAVGPKLAAEAEGIVGDGYGGVPIHQLDPGMDIPPVDLRLKRQFPGQPRVLLLARTTHLEPKGVDLSALAVAQVTTPHNHLQPDLFIRGAAHDRQADRLRNKLVKLSGLPRDRIAVYPYTTDAEQLGRDLKSAALCIVPSRSEGYGLVALEAIAAGTPILVSRNSGVALTLSAQLGMLADPMIVDVTDNKAKDVGEWRRRIQRVLDDLESTFDYTHQIREQLVRKMRWEDTVTGLIGRLRLVS